MSSGHVISLKRLAVTVVIVGLAGLAACGGTPPGRDEESGDSILAKAYADRATDLEVEGAGLVERMLSDDEEGSRHQRFILRLQSGQTLLIAHNIDVAPRAEGLRVGDTIAFRGVYEWSQQGGTVHWTHRDPEGEHAPGWIRHRGVQYD